MVVILRLNNHILDQVTRTELGRDKMKWNCSIYVRLFCKLLENDFCLTMVAMATKNRQLLQR